MLPTDNCQGLLIPRKEPTEQADGNKQGDDLLGRKREPQNGQPRDPRDGHPRNAEIRPQNGKDVRPAVGDKPRDTEAKKQPWV